MSRDDASIKHLPLTSLRRASLTSRTKASVGVTDEGTPLLSLCVSTSIE